MDVIPVEQMNTAMLQRLVQMRNEVGAVPALSRDRSLLGCWERGSREGSEITNIYHPTHLNINCQLEKSLTLEEEHQQRYFDFWRSEENVFAKQVTNDGDGAGHQSQQISYPAIPPGENLLLL
ncbi:hypothetical protein FDENT_3603 [Fusarium denticulatum]|uniref:Uncharacterized protein n=1 Tax=Fusarium denticulatum TaxID=48507 RepID=A0A8H6CSA1_9HYPO|nr:hypothetical protein FDENT_3603 [Fusarium denticulatum]